MFLHTLGYASGQRGQTFNLVRKIQGFESPTQYNYWPIILNRFDSCHSTGWMVSYGTAQMARSSRG